MIFVMFCNICIKQITKKIFLIMGHKKTELLTRLFLLEHFSYSANVLM